MTNLTFSFNYTVNVNGADVNFAVTQDNVKDVWFADDFAGFVQKGVENFAGYSQNNAATAFNSYMGRIVELNSNFVANTFNPFV